MTDRQRREIEYHAAFAKEHSAKATEPVDVSILGQQRWWWNAYWTAYTRLLELDLSGKLVLVPGCGFGDDAIRLSCLGAEVYGFDISPEMIEIAKERVNRFASGPIRLAVMPVEAMAYPADYFDAVLFIDILHHVDIAKAVTEISRVLKPGGMIIGDELYTHSWLQRIRESRWVAQILYPHMVRFIYGTDRPYITVDEHKINEVEFALVTKSLTGTRLSYFNCMAGRIFPQRFVTMAKIDRALLACIGSMGKIFAGRVVFWGRVLKVSLPTDRT